jgi:hypothetical protein
MSKFIGGAFCVNTEQRFLIICDLISDNFAIPSPDPKATKNGSESSPTMHFPRAPEKSCEDCPVWGAKNSNRIKDKGRPRIAYHNKRLKWLPCKHKTNQNGFELHKNLACSSSVKAFPTGGFVLAIQLLANLLSA